MKYTLNILLPKLKTIGIGTLAIDSGDSLFFCGSQTYLMRKADVTLIGVDGIKLRGFEPVGFEKNGREKFNYQEWWCRYEEQK